MTLRQNATIPPHCCNEMTMNAYLYVYDYAEERTDARRQNDPDRTRMHRDRAGRGRRLRRDRPATGPADLDRQPRGRAQRRPGPLPGRTRPPRNTTALAPP